MTEKPLVILGSARKQSDTKNFLNKVFDNIDIELIDLLDFHIFPFDYSNLYPNTDDFMKIIRQLSQHQIIVFATPVYWYAMSGLMKTFFDRFTDLVITQKQLGRRLQGKATFLLAVGADEELPDGFEVPFELTSHYLNMTYQDCIYYSSKHQRAEQHFQQTRKFFINKIEKCYR